MQYVPQWIKPSDAIVTSKKDTVSWTPQRGSLQSIPHSSSRSKCVCRFIFAHDIRHSLHDSSDDTRVYNNQKTEGATFPKDQSHSRPFPSTQLSQPLLLDKTQRDHQNAVQKSRAHFPYHMNALPANTTLAMRSFRRIPFQETQKLSTSLPPTVQPLVRPANPSQYPFVQVSSSLSDNSSTECRDQQNHVSPTISSTVDRIVSRDDCDLNDGTESNSYLSSCRLPENDQGPDIKTIQDNITKSSGKKMKLSQDVNSRAFQYLQSSSANTVNIRDIEPALALASLALLTRKDTSIQSDKIPVTNSLNFLAFQSQNAEISKTKFEQSTRWICDRCNSASFLTYEEAQEHERLCKPTKLSLSSSSTERLLRKRSFEDKNNSPLRSRSRLGAENSDDKIYSSSSLLSGLDQGNQQFSSGSMKLSISSQDSHYLSEVECLIRNECIEVFAPDKEYSNSMKINEKSCQVGLRCVFCKSVPLSDRSPASYSIPSSLHGLYESAKRWHCVHFDQCMSVPREIREKLQTLRDISSWFPETRQYWLDSARALGIVETSSGLSFSHYPAAGSDSGCGNKIYSRMEATVDEPDKVIIFPEDKDLVHPYVFCLLNQLEICYFSEADKFLSRSKGVIGFPGLQCRHCQGHAGIGRYFPSSLEAMSVNSMSQNIYSHLMRCRWCPQTTKDEINRLKIIGPKNDALAPGWRKAYFHRLWCRLHGLEGTSDVIDNTCDS